MVRKTKKRGRPNKRTNWQNLHHSSVVFLHWIGFDQRSALSPPNEETTQALGFLAYDFFGKIVEKVGSFVVDVLLSLVLQLTWISPGLFRLVTLSRLFLCDWNLLLVRAKRGNW